MYNTETTLRMGESELKETANRLWAMIKRLRERGSTSEDLEWDLCYVQREIDLRSARADTNRRLVTARDYTAPHETNN